MFDLWNVPLEKKKGKEKKLHRKKQKKKISKTMTTNVSFLFHFRRFINFMCIDFRIAIIFTEIENEIEIFLLPLVVMIRLAFLKESLFCITFYDQRNNYKRKYFRSSQEQRLSHTILSKKKKQIKNNSRLKDDAKKKLYRKKPVWESSIYLWQRRPGLRSKKNCLLTDNDTISRWRRVREYHFFYYKQT